jgi:YVTN family beta-propeller protein
MQQLTGPNSGKSRVLIISFGRYTNAAVALGRGAVIAPAASAARITRTSNSILTRALPRPSFMSVAQLQMRAAIRHRFRRVQMRRLVLLAISMPIIQAAEVCFAVVLSSSNAFGHSPQLAAVSGRDQLALHDVATGAELARFDAPGGSSDLLALGSGVALSNHTAKNEVILIDLNRRREIGRLPSSSLGGTRPVHMYLSPAIEERQYVVVLNDGNERSTPKGERPKDSTLLLIDAVQSSPTFLKPVGEARLGIGHHKVGFSMKRHRLAVSNISDCSDVVSVYDYANPSQIKLVKTFSAADLGYDGSTPLKTCDEAGKVGLMLSPHGTGTSAATDRIYHFLTGTGQIALFDVDADVPTVKLIQTAGSGGASVKDLPGGRFMVVPQRGPREVHQRADGALCQVGQLVVIDAAAEKVAAQLPVFYDATCRTSIAGKQHERAALQYAMPTPDGKTVFVEIGTLYGPPNVVSESRFVAVFDLTDPYRPVQLPSIPVGAGNDTRDHALTGDGTLLLVPNSLEDSVSVIDVRLRQAVRTIPTVTRPFRVVTFSEGVGPSKPAGPATLEYK